MDSTPKQIEIYATEEGKYPFEVWRDSLRDRLARAKINFKIDKVEEGLMGVFSSVGGGVYEFKIDYGPGYRIYFGMEGENRVVLLWGGDKSAQDRDILKA